MRAPDDALCRFADEVSRAGDARAAHQAFQRFVVATMPCSGLFLVAFDPGTRTRRCLYAWSTGEEIEAETLPPLPLNDGPPSRAILEAAPVLTGDYQRATRGQFRVDVGRHLDPRVPESCVCVPVLSEGEVVGVLEVQSVEWDAYGPAQAGLLGVAAALLAPTFRDARPPAAKAGEPAGPLEQADEEHAMARGLVRGLLKRLGEKSAVRPEVLRDIGREMGAGLQARDVADAAKAYAAMGFGHLQLVSEAGHRRVFHGHDLLERDLRSAQPTCHFALGFLEGALGSATQRGTLGAELRCQSQGNAHCEFVVAARPVA